MVSTYFIYACFCKQITEVIFTYKDLTLVEHKELNWNRRSLGWNSNSSLPVSLHSFSAYVLPYEALSVGRINPSSSFFFFWWCQSIGCRKKCSQQKTEPACLFSWLCRLVFCLWPHPSTKSTTSTGQHPSRTHSSWSLGFSQCSPCPFKPIAVMPPRHWHGGSYHPWLAK